MTLTFDGPLDLGRMRRERHARLVASMQEDGADALLLLGQGNVAYATGLTNVRDAIPFPRTPGNARY